MTATLGFRTPSSSSTTTAARRLDAALGDPRDPRNPFGFEAWARRDHDHEYPAVLAGEVGPQLRLAGIPREAGGDLEALDETLQLIRSAARRDAAVMPATMFSITAATCVLLAGNPEQKRAVVGLLASGRAVGFALSEAGHGSDLLANEVTATPAGAAGADGYEIHGEKWMVGLGERCDALLLVARTGGRGPAAFSAFLLDGDQVRAARRQGHATTGMRGIDFATFRFEGLRVRPEQMVGRAGRGMETAMKAMQLVRTTSTAANLACADTGLRLALDFATTHRVAGRPVVEHAAPRRELATAAALLLAGDAFALADARAAHVIPGAQNLWSSTAKKVLTEVSQEVFARCADVLGTRAVLADGPAGAFAAARADNAVVRFIDTSPAANGRLVAMRLPGLAAAGPVEAGAVGAALFGFDTKLPPLRLEALELSGRGGDLAFASLRDVVDRAEDALPSGAIRTRTLLRRLVSAIEQSARDVRDLGHAAGGGGPEAQDLAERYAFLHAAAACVHVWWFNRHLPLHGGTPGDAGWLVGAVQVLLDRACGRNRALDPAATEAVLGPVLRLHAQDLPFTAAPAETAPAETAGGKP